MERAGGIGALAPATPSCGTTLASSSAAPAPLPRPFGEGASASPGGGGAEAVGSPQARKKMGPALTLATPERNAQLSEQMPMAHTALPVHWLFLWCRDQELERWVGAKMFHENFALQVRDASMAALL